MAKLLIQMPDGQEITHDLPEDITTIGRRPDNSLQIEDASVSSHHAEIFFENNAFFVKDLGSTNGTYLNGGQIKKAPLNHDDELRFGSIVTQFKSLNDSGEVVVEDGEAESFIAETSRRPENFSCSSPLPLASDKSDPRAMTYLLAAAAIGLVSIGGAVYMILQIQAPTP
jgi:pSer/pThr/pTyr-binding forkhead associated (FHA) protein